MYQGTDKTTFQKFKDHRNDKGILNTIGANWGQDIYAA